MGFLSFLFVALAVLSAIGGAMAGVFIPLQDDKRPSAVPVVFGLLGMLGFLLLSNSFGQVPSGSRGVVTRFGAVTGATKEPGLYFVNPLFERVELMDCQVHAYKASATAASHDMQNVTTEVTLNFHLDPNRAAEMFNKMRRDYGERIIIPSVQEAVKSVTARYEAEKLITERSAVSTGIEEVLVARLAKYGIIADQMSITNFAFSADFSNAIEAKVVATQLALKAENEVREAKFHSDAVIAKARGDAEAIRIQAEAIQSQGGAEYVKLKAIEHWNGELPQWWTAGTGPLPFLNMTSGK